ncbi:MAG TPA: capsular biosynthesis protein [Burkholderiaceae bacterium]|jgi:capsular polysaccharide transport system permease protein|nr:capsular biosynthesis protein [Burkholderiaceae bacterium]
MIQLKDLTPRRLKAVLIALPMLLATLYYTVFAADRYVSESTVALERASSDASSLPGVALLLAGLSSPSRGDAFYLRQYMQSLALLQVLDAKLDLRKHYGAEKLDVFSRLWADSSQERFLEYFRNRVDVLVDDNSATVTVRVQGFDPKFAQALNQAILKESERFVNEMSHSLARERLSFAESELARAAEHLERSTTEVLAFQSKHSLLDPSIDAQASGALSAQMQASITKSEAELRGLRSFMTENAPQVKALRAQIVATQAQLEVERARATGSSAQSERLGALTIEFKGLRMRTEFAADAYKVALVAIESARMDATRKLTSLVLIEPATLPETAEYPRRLYNLATLLVGCLLLYAVVRLVLATIREHQD